MAGLRNGEQVTLYADPGGRSVVVSIRPEDSCDPVVAEVPVQVVASATTKIRIVADVSYDLTYRVDDLLIDGLISGRCRGIVIGTRRRARVGTFLAFQRRLPRTASDVRSREKSLRHEHGRDM